MHVVWRDGEDRWARRPADLAAEEIDVRVVAGLPRQLIQVQGDALDPYIPRTRVGTIGLGWPIGVQLWVAVQREAGDHILLGRAELLLGDDLARIRLQDVDDRVGRE